MGFVQRLHIQLSQLRCFERRVEDNEQGHAAAEDDRSRQTHDLGRHSRFEFADFIRRADENVVHGRDPAFQFVGCGKLIDRVAHPDADAVKHAGNAEKQSRKVEIGGDTEGNHAQSEAGSRGHENRAGMFVNRPVGEERCREQSTDRRRRS